MSNCNKYCSKKNKGKLKGANKEWRIKKIMEINGFNELVTDVVDKAISQIEQSSNAFEVDFTSSAGFDYDMPSFDISVNGITDFSFDGIGGINTI